MKRTSITAVVTAALVVGVSGCSSPSPTSGMGTATPTSTAPTSTAPTSVAQLQGMDTAEQNDALNVLMRGWYRSSAATTMKRYPLILVPSDGRVDVYREGQSTTVPVAMEETNNLKNYGHISLGLFGVLWPVVNGETSEHATSSIQEFIKAVQLYDANLPKLNLSTAQSAACAHLIDGSLELANRALSPGLTAAVLREGLAALAPAASEILGFAGDAYLRAYQDTADQSEMSVGTALYEQAVIIAAGSAPARRDSANLAVFVKHFGPDQIGNRIFYAENIYEATGARDLLGAILSDRALAEQMFGDPHALWQDALSATATKFVGDSYLPVLPPAK